MKIIFFLLFLIYGQINIFSQNNNSNLMVRQFLNQPFNDPSIILPNNELLIYNSFEELFNHIGNPIGEFSTNHPGTNYDGNFTRGFIYEYYDICTIYVASRNVVFVYLIWFKFEKGVTYSKDVMKNDSPQKIQNIFGEPNYIERIDEYTFEYSFYLDNFSTEILKFQFTNFKLSAIIYILIT